VHKFVARRALESVVAMFAISLLVFLMLHLVPGDPVRAMFGEAGSTREQMETIRQQLGLDRPLPDQFVTYVGRLLRGDFGTSFKMGRPVAEVLATQLPATIELAAMAMLIAVLLGLLAGIIAAVYHNTLADTVTMAITLIGISVPNFWLGLVFIIVFSYYLQWLPAVGSGGMISLILPSLTLGLWAAGSLARLVRSSMLEVLNQDYVRTARAKGLARWVVIGKHGLRNALIPVVTMIGILAGNALSGAIIVEAVFSRSGIGRTLVTSIVGRDFPMVQGTVLLIAAIFLTVNLLVDLSYGLIDPRIKTGMESGTPRRAAGMGS